MKVLFWSELFWPYIGGAEVFGGKLLRALSNRNHQFAIITSHDNLNLPDLDSYDGIPVYRFPFRAAVSGRLLSRFREVTQGVAKLLADFQPDIVHINALGPSVAFHFWASGTNKTPILFTLQQEILASQTGPGTLLYQLLAAADRVVGVSDSVLQQVRSLAPQISPKTSRIYNGTDPPPIPPAPLPFDPPTLLCLGRLVPAKRIDWALQAIAQLRGRFPGLRLKVAGDGPLRGELEARARELAIENSVRFLGWVDPAYVYETINEATCILMPSLREGLPVAGVQAAMMGRPIVGTGVGGLAEVVRQGESGFLVDPNDLETFIKRVSQILENPEQTRRVGASARTHALETFDWTSTVDRYEQLYREVRVNSESGAPV
jgi:glycogen(starch) synthase